MALEGKGFYMWKVHRCEGGDPNKIMQRAVSAGLTHVLIKVADGSHAYNVDLAAPVVEALKSAGIQTWGWQFVYGNEPFEEADIAAHRIITLGLDGFVVNAETPSKNKHAAASAYMGRLANKVSHISIGLSSFRYPFYHPELPWTEFLTGCTYNLPQVYWIQANNPGEQLERSIRQFQDVFPIKPIIPTGSAYEEFGWRPQPQEIRDFMEHARKLKIPAINFWSWDYAGSPEGTDFWDVIAAFDWPVSNPLRDMTDILVDALNARDIEKVTDLYQENAVLITSRDTFFGKAKIRSHYTTLLRDLPGATFVLETRVTEGSIRHIKWDARNASNGKSVDNAQDTIGLRQGKIQYHSTVYRIE